MGKALIAMSGGVDSSVAAAEMQRRGYECVGCTMKLYANADVGQEGMRTCCSLEDVEDARSVAYRLGMPYYVFNFSEDFRARVMEPFVCAYEAGITPNPCIECNRRMKFEKLFERAEVLGCEYVVTGHYARIERGDGGFLLKKALDETKDQSYVLYFLSQEQLSRIVFPLGALRKTEVRRIAAEHGFLNAEKADSQDICFVPDGDYASFIERWRGHGAPEGDFVSPEGEVLGRHRGVIRYTVGQRKGLGAFGKPMYVRSIDGAANTVTLCENCGLYSRALLADGFHWISGGAPSGPVRCRAKTRYRQPEQDAVAEPVGESEVRIVFDRAQRAITPGQAAVLYDGDVVLGGGVIRRAEP